MGELWPDCIVTLIDLAGMKRGARSGEASKLMRRFHRLVTNQKASLPAISYIYLFNDSALLLAYVDGSDASFEDAARQADKLKRRVDRLTKSYAISVKGQAFPSVQDAAEASGNSSVTFVRASSWAMANCFEIEKKVPKEQHSPWALDEWIAERIQADRPCSRRIALPMLPSGKRRNIHLFDGCLWES